MAKKKNPQDATRRNVQASARRWAVLTARVRDLERAVRTLQTQLGRISYR